MRRLRIKHGFEADEDERRGRVPGHEVYFRSGRTVTGLVVKRDKQAGQLLIRKDGMVLPYPLDEVDRVEELRIKESDVYSDDEIYAMRLHRRPPSNWRDHRRLADYMYEIGNYDKAKRHYLDAIAMHPDCRRGIEPRLKEVEAIIEDKEAYRAIRAAKSTASQLGRYDEAKAILEDYAEKRPGSRRRIARVLDELDSTRMRKLGTRFHRVKNRESSQLMRRYLASRAPTLGEARAWIVGPFKDALLERIRRKIRISVSEEEIEALVKTQARGALHWATYGQGSFVLDPSAKTGKRNYKAVVGDPESWWRSHGDNSSRASWMLTYAAEKLPQLFEVVVVRQTPCWACGGVGMKRHMSIRSLDALNGSHGWWETCPRCYGAKKDRAVGFR